MCESLREAYSVMCVQVSSSEGEWLFVVIDDIWMLVVHAIAVADPVTNGEKVNSSEGDLHVDVGVTTV